MVIRRNGFVVAMFAPPSPKPDSVAMLFGPVVTPGMDLRSENLVSNGLRVFPRLFPAWEAARERKAILARESKTATVVGIELRITESHADWEELRDYGSYIVAVGETLRDCLLYGSAWVHGERVSTAHDYWAPFQHNGLTAFTDFPQLVGETSLGILRELARQSQERVRLVGIKINWPKAEQGVSYGIRNETANQ